MSEIRTAEDAIRKADTFVSKYFLFRRLEGVKKVEGNWVLRYDVSVVGPRRIVTIKFDGKTGGLVEYITPD